MPPSSPRSEYLERALLASARLVRHHENDWTESVKTSARSLRRLLTVIYEELASLQAAVVPDVAADAQHPGYLVSTFDGVQLRVPYHLFDAVPTGATMQEIIAVAHAIRTFDDSTICISGSCGMYDGLGVVTDIDFCEYVPFEPRLRASFASSVARAEQIDDERVVCFGIHLFEMQYDRRSGRNGVIGYEKARWPWEPLPSQNMALGSILPRARKAKFDFLADTTAEGLIVVTDIALIVDGIHDHLYLESHPGQEIPITFSGSFVPRRLHDPLAAGRYVTFLVDETQKALERDSLSKAAKRAYALARLLTRDADADSIADTMQTHDIFIDAAIAARLQIAREIEKLPPSDRKSRLLRRMTETLEKLCRRGINTALAEVVQKSKQLDDLTGWIKNLEQYMQTKLARTARIEAELRDFVEAVREQIGTAGA